MNIRSFLKNLEINSSGIRYHMRALLVILSDEVVHEEGLPASRGSEHELVAVGCYAFSHRQVRDVNVQRLATDAVCHLDAER